LFSIHAYFGSGNVAPVSFLNNNMNKGRWTQDKHKILCKNMRSMAIIACKLQKFSAHKHPLKLNSMLNVSSNKIRKQILQQSNGIESPSLPMGKLKSWSKMVLNNKNIDNLSHLMTKFKCHAKMLMRTGNNESPFLLRKRSKF
jgi:hypothetical protein